MEIFHEHYAYIRFDSMVFFQRSDLPGIAEIEIVKDCHRNSSNILDIDSRSYTKNLSFCMGMVDIGLLYSSAIEGLMSNMLTIFSELGCNECVLVFLDYYNVQEFTELYSKLLSLMPDDVDCSLIHKNLKKDDGEWTQKVLLKLNVDVIVGRKRTTQTKVNLLKPTTSLSAVPSKKSSLSSSYTLNVPLADDTPKRTGGYDSDNDEAEMAPIERIISKDVACIDSLAENSLCCAGAACSDPHVDVSNSHHYCSVSSRRVHAWCYPPGKELGFGSRAPCSRCSELVTPILRSLNYST
jgi:hypothetical protein